MPRREKGNGVFLMSIPCIYAESAMSGDRKETCRREIGWKMDDLIFTDVPLLEFHAIAILAPELSLSQF